VVHEDMASRREAFEVHGDIGTCTCLDTTYFVLLFPSHVLPQEHLHHPLITNASADGLKPLQHLSLCLPHSYTKAWGMSQALDAKHASETPFQTAPAVSSAHQMLTPNPIQERIIFSGGMRSVKLRAGKAKH
jgi:hypothetical protein